LARGLIHLGDVNNADRDPVAEAGSMIAPGQMDELTVVAVNRATHVQVKRLTLFQAVAFVCSEGHLREPVAVKCDCQRRRQGTLSEDVIAENVGANQVLGEMARG
jgi:hypothetical protein